MGCLWCGKYSRQCKTMPSGPPEFIPPFIPVTGMKCSYGKISSPLTEISVGKTEISGTEPARPLIWTHRKFYKGFRGKARSRKPGQPGQPGSYEEVLNVQNEMQLLSRVFCYSWLVCLLGFWLRNTSLVKVGNPISDGIVFVFHLAWCVRGLKSLKRFWPYLIVFSASQMVSLSNYFIWCLFLISNLMKSGVAYAASQVMHVCKIWGNDLTEYKVWL